MSDIQKPIQQVQDLEFLNGEIGKLRETKKSIEEDLLYLRSTHNSEIEQFHQDIVSRQSKINLLDRQISSQEQRLQDVTNETISLTEKLSDLNDAIKKNQNIVANSMIDLSFREQTLKEKEENNKKDRIQLEDDIRNSLSQRKEISDIRISLKTREDRVTFQEGELEKNKNLLNNRENKLKETEKQNRQTFELNAQRSAEIQKQSEELNVLKRNFEITKQDSINRDAGIQDKLNTLKFQQEDLNKQNKVTEERERLSVIREQKAILKDEELRIREKRISLKEQSGE